MTVFGTVPLRPVLAVQLAIVLAVLLVAALLPPRHGRMLLIPLPWNAHGAVAGAVDSGALLLGPGSFPDSYVVEGDRDTIAAPLRGKALLVAAPAILCSDAGTRRA